MFFFSCITIIATIISLIPLSHALPTNPVAVKPGSLLGHRYTLHAIHPDPAGNPSYSPELLVQDSSDITNNGPLNRVVRFQASQRRLSRKLRAEDLERREERDMDLLSKEGPPPVPSPQPSAPATNVAPPAVGQEPIAAPNTSATLTPRPTAVASTKHIKEGGKKEEKKGHAKKSETKARKE